MKPRGTHAKLPKFILATLLAAGVAGIASQPYAAEGDFIVSETEIVDYKAVFATVQSADVVPARARIGGKVTELSVGEGDSVTAGQKIATVVDDKLAIRIQSLDARIRGLQASLTNASAELQRGEELKQRGIIAQARLDQLQTTADVAQHQLSAAEAERSVSIQQIAEGAVEAPAAGRVLAVPVTVGTVVLTGETIAELASDRYLLRLEVPERHARYIELGDEILIGARGLSVTDEAVGKGTIVTVYPRLQNGRVVADAEVAGLGGYFVGERALVRIAAGERKTFVIPQDYVFKRYGLDYVRVEGGEGHSLEVVVQLGQKVGRGKPGEGDPMVEVLGGLQAGDRLVRP